MRSKELQKSIDERESPYSIAESKGEKPKSENQI